MDVKITATYRLYYDLLQAMHHQEDLQCQMSDAEVLTTVLTAALYFRGNIENTRARLQLQLLTRASNQTPSHGLQPWSLA